MAIISDHAICGGWKVIFTSGGRQYSLRFSAQPSTAERNEAIAVFEQRITDEIATDMVLDTDEVL